MRNQLLIFLITFIILLPIRAFAENNQLPLKILKGLEIVQEHCSRCHLVSTKNKYSSIETTPSFFSLREMKDWKVRFNEFFVRPPHPAFTNIKDVTERSKKLPAFVAEIDLDLEQIENLISYVEQMKKIKQD